MPTTHAASQPRATLAASGHFAAADATTSAHFSAADATTASDHFFASAQSSAADATTASAHSSAADSTAAARFSTAHVSAQPDAISTHADPAVQSMALLAIGIAPTVSGADSAGLLKRAADLAKEADDQRMQRICEHLSKLVSGVLKI